MSKELISIQEASEISEKSIQTIRRAIKAKKIKFKRQKTPQGFNYLVNRESLFAHYKLKEKKESNQTKSEIKKVIVDTSKPTVKSEAKKEKSKKKEKIEEKKDDYMTKDDFSSLTKALERIISQHSDERQNFLRLINTLNEKMFELEGQMKMLAAPKKKWFQIWKK